MPHTLSPSKIWLEVASCLFRNEFTYTFLSPSIGSIPKRAIHKLSGCNHQSTCALKRDMLHDLEIHVAVKASHYYFASERLLLTLTSINHEKIVH